MKAKDSTNLSTETPKSEINWEATENGEIGFGFIGKENVLRMVRKVRPRVLKEIPELSLGSEEEKEENIVIEGDNLKVMATLYQYHGKIDLILTDPPYNTGKDFRYNDKWDKDLNDEGLGDYVKFDDTSKHTKWLKFMVSRLQFMKRMLKPGGVLAICIDERELSRLLPVLDDKKIMFGQENRLAIITWEKSTPKNDAKHVSNTTEYVLVYTKKEESVNTERLERPESLDKRYSNPDNDLRGAWVADNPSAKRDTFSSVYAIQNPFTGKLLLPPPGASWRWQKSKIKNWLEEYGSEYEEYDLQDDNALALVLKGVSKFADLTANSITEKASQLAEKRLKKGNWPQLVFSQGGQGRPGIKRYLSEVRPGIVPTTYWKWEELGSISFRSEESGLTTHGTKEVIERVGEKHIGVKPLKLFTKIIRLWCPPGGLVLDPFAGSGTTGEVILKLNKELEVERERERERAKFILIEQGRPENGDNYCRTLLQQRLKAVITGKWADGKSHEPLGGGFRFFELTKQVDSNTILQMEKQELIETILSLDLSYVPLFNQTYLIAKNKQNQGIYLIWDKKNKLESNLTENVYRQCVLEQKKHNLAPVYHIYARSIAYQSSTITFHKIPDKILVDFGIDPATDTFISKEQSLSDLDKSRQE